VTLAFGPIAILLPWLPVTVTAVSPIAISSPLVPPAYDSNPIAIFAFPVVLV